MLPGGDVLEHSCIITAESVCHVCSGTHTYFTPLQYSFQHLCILGFEICVWVETFWKTFTSRERSHFLPELFNNDKYVSCDILNSHNSIFDQRDVGMQGNKKSECYKCLG